MASTVSGTPGQFLTRAWLSPGAPVVDCNGLPIEPMRDTAATLFITSATLLFVELLLIRFIRRTSSISASSTTSWRASSGSGSASCTVVPGPRGRAPRLPFPPFAPLLPDRRRLDWDRAAQRATPVARPAVLWIGRHEHQQHRVRRRSARCGAGHNPHGFSRSPCRWDLS